jgi:ParB family chromosome partitioning protein
MSKKALGRGLSALFADTPSFEQDLVELFLDQLDPTESQPRHVFHHDKLRELADSIKSNGLIQPIIVRRSGERFQIIAGERRWRASQLAGLAKIPCIIKEASDDRVLAISLIENLQREDLNPIEEAAAYKMLLDRFHATQEEVAGRIGKDRSSIANSLRLLKLPKEVQALVEQNRLSMGHARALLSVESPARQIALAAEIVGKSLSVREAERLTRKASALPNLASKRAGRPGTDANVLAAEAKLRKKLGAPVKIKLAERGGLIEIKFSSMDDLTRLYDQIIRTSPN